MDGDERGKSPGGGTDSGLAQTEGLTAGIIRLRSALLRFKGWEGEVL